MQFEKIHVCGNDFLLLFEVPDVARIKAMCARNHGLGGDGVMVYLGLDQAGSPLLYHYEFDGTRSFCLNGLRASLACLHQQQKIEICGALDYEGVHLEYKIADTVQVSLSPGNVATKAVELAGRIFKGHFVETGNPHFILFAQEVGDLDFLQIAPGLRAHAAFPAGANVHMISAHKDGWRIRSYERGVEAITLACGSGILAAASLLFEQGHATPLSFYPQGGGFMNVAQLDGQLAVSGPTDWVASGVWRC